MRIISLESIDKHKHLLMAKQVPVGNKDLCWQICTNNNIHQELSKHNVSLHRWFVRFH